jgi:hypothetical protein
MGFLGPLLDQKFNSDPIHPADLGPAARVHSQMECRKGYLRRQQMGKLDCDCHKEAIISQHFLLENTAGLVASAVKYHKSRK